MNKKRLLLSVGSITTAVAPVIGVVSCFESEAEQDYNKVWELYKKVLTRTAVYKTHELKLTIDGSGQELNNYGSKAREKIRRWMDSLQPGFSTGWIGDLDDFPDAFILKRHFKLFIVGKNDGIAAIPYPIDIYFK